MLKKREPYVRGGMVEIILATKSFVFTSHEGKSKCGDSPTLGVLKIVQEIVDDGLGDDVAYNTMQCGLGHTIAYNAVWTRPYHSIQCSVD